MTDMNGPQPTCARERLDEDDHDLLTFVEVGERLRAEVAAAESALAAASATDDEEAVEKARARLTALRAATARNSAHPINDANFERFFGYPGKARRNVVDTEAES
jgi:hypothetical protein